MEEIAEVYARALFEAAKEAGVLDRVHDELGQFADTLDQDRNLQVFFFSPYFSSEEKKQGVASRSCDDADPRFVNFLELLAERHRMPVHIPDPARVRRALGRGEQAAAGERHERRGAGRGARAATSASASRSRPGRRVELSSKVDPDLLGGLVVRVGNMVLDASVRNRLEQLRKQVTKRPA